MFQVSNNNALITDRISNALESQNSFLLKKQSNPTGPSANAKPLEIVIIIYSDTESVDLTNSEEYELTVENDSNLKATIAAETFQGARHGLETMFQLMEWDEAQGTFLMVDNVHITDRPYYTHRGVLLDTSRNFIPIPKIKEMIESLSFSKMNVFH